MFVQLLVSTVFLINPGPLRGWPSRPAFRIATACTSAVAFCNEQKLLKSNIVLEWNVRFILTTNSNQAIIWNYWEWLLCCLSSSLQVLNKDVVAACFHKHNYIQYTINKYIIIEDHIETCKVYYNFLTVVSSSIILLPIMLLPQLLLLLLLLLLF